MTFMIAIDGLAGAGKSTLGEAVARELSCAYVDTGLMYRAVTLSAVEQQILPSNAAALARVAEELDFRLALPDHQLLINNHPPLPALRMSEVDRTVSEVSAHGEVRDVLTAKQRLLAEGECVVMVGRDIGTVVFPDAPVKIWLTASEKTRALRRAGDHRASGQDDESGVARDLVFRDRFDSGRAIAPTRQPSGSIVIDTDILDPAAALAVALDAIQAARLKTE